MKNSSTNRISVPTGPTAPADGALGLSSPTVTGTAAIGDQTVSREAVPAEPALQAFVYKHDVPADEFLLCTMPSAAYTLSANIPSTEIREVSQGSDVQVLVKASRQGETKGPIKIVADKPPRGITVKAASIPADKNEVTVTISVTKQAPVNVLRSVILTGSMTVEKEKVTVVRTLPAIPIKPVAPKPKEPAKK